MNDNYIFYTKEEKDMIRNNFMVVPEKYKNDLNRKDVVWLYSIKDKKSNDVIYVGKTLDFKVRVMQYISAYIRNDRTRKIDRIIQDNGIENYIMVIEGMTKSDTIAADKEIRLIHDYDTIVNGGNCNDESIILTKETRMKHPGNILNNHHTSIAKKSKSKLMCIIDPVNKKIILCTGLKLAGDIIGGANKDDIKTHAKSCTTVKGWFLYYLNYIDFNMNMDKAKIKVDKILNHKDRCSDKTIQYGELYENYIKLGKYLKSYLKSLGNNNPENFECYYATQTDDNESGILISSPVNFIKDYQTFALKIYD